jgi:hypothetical protein
VSPIPIIYNCDLNLSQWFQILSVGDELVKFLSCSWTANLTMIFHPEVVLAVLLENFHFSPSEKEIVWQMNAIASPAVKGAKHSQLPLRVTSVHP